MKKWISLWMVVVILLVGCSNKEVTEESKGEAPEDVYGAYAVEDKDFGYQDQVINMEVDDSDGMVFTSKENTNTVLGQRKIIKTAYMTMETLEYDQAILKLQDKIAAYGGYIETSNIGGESIYQGRGARSAYFTLRVPEGVYLTFMDEVNTIGHVISKQTNGQDVTTNYYDTDARIKTLEVQEERLLAILMKAEKIEDILILEQELSSVRYDIERMTQSLRQMDQRISFSTLEVTIQEVYEITKEEVIPVKLGAKIKDGFVTSLEDIQDGLEELLINTTSFTPYLVFLVPALALVWFLLRKVRRGYKSAKLPEETEDEKNK